MRRILFLVTGFGLGGAERALLRIASGLDPARQKVGVVGLGSWGPLGDRLREAGIHAAAAGMGAASPRAWGRLLGEVKRFAPDILHAFLFHAGVAGRLARFACRVPRLAVSVRVSEPRALHIAFDRWAPAPDRTVCVCEAVREHLVSRGAVDPARAVVIPNGVDPPARGDGAGFRARLGITPDAPVAVCVARLDRQKGHADLLDAWAMGPARSGTWLVLVGDGPLRKDLEARAAERGIAERVRFAGRIDPPDDAYAAADLFVLASLWEGLPNALLEARAAGLPAVATAVGGASEILAGCASGRLVPARDPSAFAAAVGVLLMDRANARQVAREEAGALLARYRWDEAVRAHERLYDGLCAGGA